MPSKAKVTDSTAVLGSLDDSSRTGPCHSVGHALYSIHLLTALSPSSMRIVIFRFFKGVLVLRTSNIQLKMERPSSPIVSEALYVPWQNLMVPVFCRPRAVTGGAPLISSYCLTSMPRLSPSHLVKDRFPLEGISQAWRCEEGYQLLRRACWKKPDSY